MKRALVVGAAFATLAVAAPASSATPLDKKVASLQKQVTTLTKQVKQLKKDIAFARQEAVVNYYGDACSDAATAILFQSTWATIDQKYTDAPLFGPQQVFNDRAACRNIGVQKPGIEKPPSVGVFTDILGWLLG